MENRTKFRYYFVSITTFGCGAFTNEDSLEHYAGCSICVGFLRSRLRFLEPIDRGHLVALGLHRGSACLTTLVKLAMWNYVLYCSFNYLRCLPSEVRSSVQVDGVMEQYYREGSRGCSEAMPLDDDV